MSSQQLLSYASVGIACISAIWVLRDAKQLGIQKGQSKGLGNMGPLGWFFACLFLWIIAFPFYLLKRRALLQRIEGRRGLTQTSTVLGFAVFAIELIVLGVLVFGNPKESTAQLQAQVRASIIQNFAKNSKLADIQVGTFHLVHDSGNQYTGLLQVSSGGETSNLEVHVTYDGQTFMWRVVRSTSPMRPATEPVKVADTAPAMTGAGVPLFHIGQPFKLGPFTVTVTSIKLQDHIDGVAGTDTPSQGDIYVTALYTATNGSNSPLSPPDVLLLDTSNNARFEESDNTVDYASQTNTSTGMNDLNPFQTKTEAAVFEVPLPLLQRDHVVFVVGFQGNNNEVAAAGVSVAEISDGHNAPAVSNANASGPVNTPAANSVAATTQLNANPPALATNDAPAVSAAPAATVPALAPTAPGPAATAPATETTPPSPTTAIVRPSFNCARASTAAEGAICGSVELSTLDSSLSALYVTVVHQSNNPELIKKQQREWIHQRNACGANVGCLEQSYKNRMAQLREPTQVPTSS